MKSFAKKRLFLSKKYSIVELSLNIIIKLLTNSKIKNMKNKKILEAIVALLIIIGVGYGVYQFAKPVTLSVIDIPQQEFVRNLQVVDSKEYAVEAQLYEGKFNFWIRYLTPEGKVGNIVISKGGKKQNTINAVKILGNDDCQLLSITHHE